MTDFYAAYDSCAIYALGTSPDDAIANARRDAREPEAMFETAPISDAFAAQIEADGWNGNAQTFALIDGALVDTTNEDAASIDMPKTA